MSERTAWVVVGPAFQNVTLHHDEALYWAKIYNGTITRFVGVAEVQKIQRVLRRHHDWHQQIGRATFKDDNDAEGRFPYEIDLSEAYAEGALCDETIEALEGANTDPGGARK